jgi:hypothetical protein
MQHRRKEPWVCDQCGEQFTTRKLMYDHKHKHHPHSGVWNKGKTAETDPRISKWRATIKSGYESGYAAGKLARDFSITYTPYWYTTTADKTYQPDYNVITCNNVNVPTL